MTEPSKAVITEYNGVSTCFYFENGILTEIFSDDKSEIRTGDIFVAKVMNVRRDLNTVFVDIMPGVSGYLPFDEIIGYDGSTDIGIKQGDEIPVQIIAQAQKKKPYKVTEKTSIHGLYCVGVFDDKKIHVSSKLSKADRERLKALAVSLDPKTGIILRTKCATAQESDIASEIVLVSDKLHEIMQNASCRTAYSRIYEAKPAFYERLEELKPARIITDSEDSLKDLRSYITCLEIESYNDKSMPLSILYGLSSNYEESISKTVHLKSGGFLVIEPTEAMTVIDVNSGKNDSKRSKEQLVRQTNLEAAREIFRQIRLRNLSGIIIVDFINSESSECEEELKSLMKELALKDPVKTSFIDITKLGLAEITRQKKYVSFKEIC